MALLDSLECSFWASAGMWGAMAAWVMWLPRMHVQKEWPSGGCQPAVLHGCAQCTCPGVGVGTRGWLLCSRLAVHSWAGRSWKLGGRQLLRLGLAGALAATTATSAQGQSLPSCSVCLL